MMKKHIFSKILFLLGQFMILERNLCSCFNTKNTNWKLPSVYETSRRKKNKYALDVISDKVTYGEESRKYRRTMYTYSDWVKHRSPDRFIKNLGTTFNSGVVLNLFNELFYVVLISVIIVLWNGLFVVGYDDFGGKHFDPIIATNVKLCLPLDPFTISSPALSLLLIFRTNASYSRWKDGRKAWGTIIVQSRNIMRQANVWCSDRIEPDVAIRKAALKNLSHCMWTFPRSLTRHLNDPAEDEEDYQRDLKERLPLEQAQSLINARHRPYRALHDISLAINQMPIPLSQRIEVDRALVAIGDASGSCERIFSTPVPLVYSRLTSRFLAVWLLLLPFGLWNVFDGNWNHIALIPASGLISIFLLGIEELSVQLEEPFSILALHKITDALWLAGQDYYNWYVERMEDSSSSE